MSPFSIPRTLRAARPWLAAAMMLAVWLTATTARCCTFGPRAAPPAVSIRANPGWPWLQLLWATLPWGAGGGQELYAARDWRPRASASGRHGLATTGASASDTGGSSAGTDGSAGCVTDPNGNCHPGP